MCFGVKNADGDKWKQVTARKGWTKEGNAAGTKPRASVRPRRSEGSPALPTPAAPTAPCGPTFRIEARPALASRASSPEAAAGLGCLAPAAPPCALLRLALACSRRRFRCFRFLLSRFLSVAVFSAALFTSPALVFSC